MALKATGLMSGTLWLLSHEGVFGEGASWGPGFPKGAPPGVSDYQADHRLGGR